MEDATASDNGEVTIEVSSETTAGDAAGNYVIVRTFTAADDAGNSSSATQTIPWRTPQRRSSPSSLPTTESAQMRCLWRTPASDCGGVTIEVSGETTAGDARQLRAFAPSRPPTTLETAGYQTITVEDTTAPEFTFVPADYTVECSDECL